jgi:hypothetical protein
LEPKLQEKMRVAEDKFSERGCSQLGPNLLKRLKLAEVVFCSRGLFLRSWSMILEKQRLARFFSLSEAVFFIGWGRGFRSI